MADENNNNIKKKCGGRGKAMFAYGVIQLGSSVISAIALASIAFSFSSLQKVSSVFNQCVMEIEANGESSTNAIRYCNGGK